MNNILILVGEYKPYSTTNGNIASNIAEELKKYGYNVKILTRKNKKGLKKLEIIDGMQVYRITDLNLIIHSFCEQKIKNNKKIYKIFLLIKRVLFYFPRVLRRTSISNYYVHKIEENIKRISKKTKIDAIIPVSAPHEEIFAAMKYKKKNKKVKLLPYQLDRFSNANSLYPTKILKNIRMKNNLELELELLKECNNLLVLPPIYSHYESNRIFKEYLNKIIITEHPLIKNFKEDSTTSKNSIDIIYAGSLDLKLRNPTYLFEIMDSDKVRNGNIKLNLYSFGNCQNIIDKYKAKLGDIINDVGKVEHDIVITEMKKADILLTIGNNSDEEVPSKLFECLSFCKPIIHLYYSDNDAYLEYLKNYQYSICIKMDKNKLKENREIFYEFCKKIWNVDIKYKIIEELYEKCTPQYVSKQFIKIIEGK